MADVFLSYRNTPLRRAYVERLRLGLDAYSITVWWDYGLEAGREYEPQIMSELASARLICPLWCSQSIASEWVHREAQFGLQNDKLLPVRLQAVVPPVQFERIQSQDLVHWNGSVQSHLIMALASTICQSLGQPLRPEADKLNALAELPTLKPLASGNDESGMSAEADAQLHVERLAQMSALASNAHLFWNGQPIGTVAMSNAAGFKLAPGAGDFQVGMQHPIKRSMHLTLPLRLTLVSGKVAAIRFKFGLNLFGLPPVIFWLDDSSSPQKRGWLQ